MNIFNPNTLPAELISICNYYADLTRRPFNVVSFVGDPKTLLSPSGQYRGGIMGEYSPDTNRIYMYLARIQRHHSAILTLPPGLGQWLAVLDVFLHEFGHHIQKEDPFYIDNISNRGYWDCWAERNARHFSWVEIHRLADLDENLFAPRFTRELGYLGVCASNRLQSLARDVRKYSGTWILSNKLRAARLRGIHVPKSIPVEKKVQKIREVLELASVLDDENFMATFPGFDEEIPVFDEPSQDYCELCELDETYLPILERDPDWLENIPEPASVEDAFYYASGLIRKSEVYETWVQVRRKNPNAPIGEREGFQWVDKRGRIWNYLHLGQAVKFGLLENVLPRIESTDSVEESTDSIESTDS